MSNFIIKQNDTLPVLEAQLLNADGTPLNIELCGVHFHMIDRNGQKKINSPTVIVDAVNGMVRYDWNSGDTEISGLYKAEFEVVFPDSTILTVPNDGYFIINIQDELS